MPDLGPGLPEELRAVGAQRRQSTAPESIDRDWLAGQCEMLERILRKQDEAEEVPFEFTERDRRALKALQPTDTTHALKRWAYLKHLYWTRSEGRVGTRSDGGAPSSPEEAEEAARKLLQREPVTVDLANRTVKVTGRSYAAMHAMARHETRIEELREDLERISDLRDEARDNRARFRRLGRIQRLALKELQLHRKMLYAHAFTPDGAPAESLDEAPDWWDEVDPAEDALLLVALFQAGPGRLMKLGPAEDQDGGGEKADDWGYKSLLASLERQTRSEPASYFNRDMGQLIAWVRGGAPPKPEGLEE